MAVTEIRPERIVGKINTELIPDNKIERVEWTEDTVSIGFSQTDDMPISALDANSTEIFFASNSIDSANPFACYKGEIVTGTSAGRIAFFNIITPSNDRFYDVDFMSEPYCVLRDIEGKTNDGGSMQRTPYDSFNQFKSSILSGIYSSFTHEYGFITNNEYPYNERLSRVNIGCAVAIDKAYYFQMMIGCPAELYSIVRDSDNKSKGGEKNIFSLISNELFQSDTLVANKSIGESIATDVLSKYAKGRQTISFSIIAEEQRLVHVGDTVIPYSFSGQPISKKMDGNAKQFIVTSAEFSYKGSYRQNLSLVEVK